MSKNVFSFPLWYFLFCISMVLPVFSFAAPEVKKIFSSEKIIAEELLLPEEFPLPDTENRNLLQYSVNGNSLTEKREKEIFFEHFLSSRTGENFLSAFLEKCPEKKYLRAGSLFQLLLASVLPERAGPGERI